MTRLFCLALLILGLGGCANTTTPASPTDTIIVPTTTDGATNGTTNGVPTPANAVVTTPAVPETSCGEINVSGEPLRAQDANAAGEAAVCFVEAFRACRATTLGIQDLTHNLFRQFSITPASGKCELRQALQTDPAAPPAVADCQSAALENNTLTIKACSHLGDFVLTP